jgi:hypothetical protein
MHSRLLRDFIILRSAIPAPDPAPQLSAPSAPSAQPEGTEATVAPPEPQPCLPSASSSASQRLSGKSPAALSPDRHSLQLASVLSASSAQPEGAQATLASPEPQLCLSSASPRLRVKSPAPASATPPVPNEPKTPLSINKTRLHTRSLAAKSHWPSPKIDLILRRARRRLR